MSTLRDLRVKIGLTQEELAEKVGITVRCYQQYESYAREPRSRTAIRLARTLHTTVEELWGCNLTA